MMPMSGATTMPGIDPTATSRPAELSGLSKCSRMSGMAGANRLFERMPVMVTA